MHLVSPHAPRVGPRYPSTGRVSPEGVRGRRTGRRRRTGPVTSTGERCPAPFRSIGHPSPRAVALDDGLRYLAVVAPEVVVVQRHRGTGAGAEHVGAVVAVVVARQCVGGRAGLLRGLD